MATLTGQQATNDGAQVTYAPAAAGGDKFAHRDGRVFSVRNDDATATTVTIAVPGNTQYGQPNPDIARSVPAGQEYAFRSQAVYVDPADSLIAVTYSKVASLTVAVRDS